MKDRGYIIPRQKGEILPSSLTSYQLLYRISRNFSRGHELDNKRHEYPRVWRCLSSKRRRAPHKLLPSRDTQARKLYSFFVSISSPPLIPGHRMQISPQPRLDGRILAAIFFPPPFPRFSIPGKIDEKAFYTGMKGFRVHPLRRREEYFKRN